MKYWNNFPFHWTLKCAYSVQHCRPTKRADKNVATIGELTLYMHAECVGCVGQDLTRLLVLVLTGKP